MSESIGLLIDEMYKAREAYREATKIAKSKEEIVKDIEQRLIATMKIVDIENARATLATATLAERSVATIKDWDSFTPWVEDDVPGRIHLLEKRIAQLAFREYMEQNNQLPPGVETYELDVIRLLKRS